MRKTGVGESETSLDLSVCVYFIAETVAVPASHNGSPLMTNSLECHLLHIPNNGLLSYVPMRKT